MARVYISSTYEDLKDHRQAVIAQLRRMHHDVVGMEDYAAQGIRPLDKCLQDVASCDAYVGILGWRFGFVPAQDNPEGRSITELEYREATKLGKQCFIFLQNDDYIGKQSDFVTGENERGERIKRLREELQEATLRDSFGSAEDLGGKAASALASLAQMGNASALKELKGLGVLILKLYTYQSVHDRLDDLYKATAVLRSERPEDLTKQTLDKAVLDGKDVVGGVNRSLQECNRFFSEEERRDHQDRKLGLEERIRKLGDLAAASVDPDIPTLAREVHQFNHTVVNWRDRLNLEAEKRWKEIRLGELTTVLDRLRLQVPPGYYERVQRGVTQLSGEPPLHAKCNVLTTERNSLRQLLSLFASLWNELEHLDAEDLKGRCRAIRRRVQLAREQWLTYVSLQGSREEWETLLLGDGQDHWEDIDRYEADMVTRIDQLEGGDTGAPARLGETLRKAQKRLEAHCQAVDEALGKAFDKVNSEIGRPLIEGPVLEESHG